MTTKPTSQLAPISFTSSVLANEVKKSPVTEIATSSYDYTQDDPERKSNGSPAAPRKDSERRVVVPVLIYHYIQNSEGRDALTQDLSVTPENLDQQLNYLDSEGFKTISPEQLYEGLTSNTPLPAKPILLTFDDGYQDFFTTAYPLLKKHQAKTTNFVPIGLVDRFQYLSTFQVKELASDPLITLAGHTLHHADLTTSTKESAWDEISNGKTKLEEVIGKKVDFFAYPYGTFNDQIVNLVKEGGFKMAFTTRYGTAHSATTLLALPRVRIGGTDSLPVFAEKVGGSVVSISR